MSKDRLNGGEVLSQGEELISKNSIYRFVFQKDANLVLYNGSDAIWSTGTDTSMPNTYECVMKHYGRLVIHNGNGKDIWASDNERHPGAYLIVQNDGNVVIYDSQNKPLWSTGTNK